MTIQEYAAEIDKLAVKSGAIKEGESYCDFVLWQDAFNDGLTPEQAWAEEYNPT